MSTADLSAGKQTPPEKKSGRKPASAGGAEGFDPTGLYVRRKIWSTLVFLFLLLVAVGLSGVFLRSEMTSFANWVHNHLGFGGLAAVLLISETVVSPIPPDLILWIVATSDLSRDWLGPVSFLALLSTLGGHVGWLLGGQLGDTRLVRRAMGRYRRKSVNLMQRYGIWAVVLAALTPVPWSVTSWSAGILKMPWRLYLLGSLVRIPRHLVYYITIHVAFHRAVEVSHLL